MPISPRDMPFFQHFVELRKRATISLAAVLILSFIFYEDRIYGFLLKILLHPIAEYIPQGGLTVLGPFETLTFRFKIAVIAALIVSAPLIIYQIFAFLAPGLKPNERKWIFPTVGAAIVLFISGALFAYFVVMGPAFEWMAAQGAGYINSIAAAGPYLSGISLMLLGFGIGFELPLVVFYLIGFSIIPYDAIRGGWRYAYVGIVIVAAVATPDWSPWTMGGLSLALIILYEGSLLLSRLVFKKKIAEQREDKKMEEEMYGDSEPEEPAPVRKLTRQQELIKQAAEQRRAEKKRMEAALKLQAAAELEEERRAKEEAARLAAEQSADEPLEALASTNESQDNA